MRSIVAVALGVAFLGKQVASQVVGADRLRNANGRLVAEFTQVSSVRELKDGSVLVSDSRDARIVLGNFISGQIEAIGRKGQGPGEYEGTLLLLALKADSSIMIDMTRRIHLFDGGRIVGVVPLDAPIAREARGFIPGTDTLGHALLTRSATNPGNRQRVEERDSVQVVLLERSSGRADTIARVRAMPAELKTTTTPNGSMTIRQVSPFGAGEEARLFPDGWVAIARLDPYRVDWRAPDGRMTIGQALPGRLAAVTARDRQAFIDAHPVAAGRPSFYDFDRFPQQVPPFESRSALESPLFAAGDGTLIVRRTLTASDSEPRYDVIDRGGRLLRQVVLKTNERIAGFGAHSVYVVERDRDDIEKLRRHPWP